MDRIKDLSSVNKAVLWYCGAMNELKKLGLVNGGNVDMTPEGIALWDQLDASGVRPNDAALEDIIVTLDTAPEEDIKPMVRLLGIFRDDRGTLSTKGE